MSPLQKVPLGLGGLGDISQPHSELGDAWRDCDRTLVEAPGLLVPWPGYNRLGEILSKAALHGTAEDRLHIVSFDNELLRRDTGHGLAVVDASSLTRGRILALAHHASGTKAEQMIGRPRQTTGTGLNDLESRGIFSGASAVAYIILLSVAGGTDSFQWSDNGGSSFSASIPITGDWQTIEDGLSIKFAATTGHTLNNRWVIVAGARPAYLGSMNRQTPHHYPSIAGGQSTLLISHAFDTVKADIGQEVREAGLPAPHIKPTARVETPVTTDIGNTDLGNTINGATNASPIVITTNSAHGRTTGDTVHISGVLGNAAANGNWTITVLTSTTYSLGGSTGNGVYVGSSGDSFVRWQSSGAEGITLAHVTTSPSPADGTASVKINVPIAMRAGQIDLAYTNVTGTPVIPAGVKRVKVWIYADFPTGFIERDKLSFVFASAAALGGTRVVLPIHQRIAARKWFQCDLKWTETTSFSYLSMGLRMERSIGERKFTNGILPILVDAVTIDGDGANAGSTEPSTTFDGDGLWRFAFCWYRRSDKRQSAPSPWSEPLELDGSSIRIDVSGRYPGITAGLQNAAPDSVDAIMLYVSNDTWDEDPRTGGPAFFRCSPDDGIAIEDLDTETTVSAVSGTATAQGSLAELEASVLCPSATWTITNIGGGTTFSVSDGTTTYDLATQDTPYDNSRVRFIIRETGTFTAGLVFTFTTTQAEFTTGELVTVIADEKSADLLNAPDSFRMPFMNGFPRQGDLLVSDGPLVVSAVRPAYRVSGGFTWTDDSHTIVPVVTGNDDTQIILGRWMEGRDIRRVGETTLYRILKWIEPNATFTRGALYIGVKFDPKDQELEGPYDGTTGNAVGEIVADNKRIYWTNNSNEFGIDVEASSVLNFHEPMPDNDEIVGGGKVDEFLFVIGHNNCFIYRRFQGSLADLPRDTGPAYPNPVHIVGVGMLAPRTWTRRPDGTAIFVGAKGELYIAGKGGVQLHPKSQAFTSFLSGTGFLADTRRLRYAWGAIKYDGQRELYIFHLIPGFNVNTVIEDASGLDITHRPGVVRKAKETFSFATD